MSAPPKPKIWQRFLAGTVSGAALTAVGHPLDTLRVKLQVEGGGLLSVLRALWRAEGARGLYRGFLPPLLLTGLVNTVLWGVQFSLVDELAARGEGGNGTTRAMLAAVPASIASAALVAPMELVKTRQQTSATLRQPVRALLREVLRREGPRGLFRGFGIVCCCRLFGGWGYFGGNAYALEALTSALPPQGVGGRTRNTLLAGGFAGVCYWALAMPFDTVKSTLMALEEGQGMRVTARKIYARGGALGFYRGFSAAVLRALPANAAAFTAFDITMRSLT